jgi:hypothetical protein
MLPLNRSEDEKCPKYYKEQGTLERLGEGRIFLVVAI